MSDSKTDGVMTVDTMEDGKGSNGSIEEHSQPKSSGADKANVNILEVTIQCV
jgi:hypothetical protein